VLGISIVILRFHVNTEHRAVEFIRHWASLFQGCRNTSSIRSLPESENIFIRVFSNQQWIAVRSEADCTDGAGFMASVFVDSEGAVKFQRGYHFCGYEGLSSELSKVKADNLAEFYAALTNIQLHLWQPVGSFP
jgi:hypothetical protein